MCVSGNSVYYSQWVMLVSASKYCVWLARLCVCESGHVSACELYVSVSLEVCGYV